jgi:hypothetical protein
MIVMAVGNPGPTGPPEEISPAEFAYLVEQNQVFTSSGSPLKLVTDQSTGLQFLRGSYYTLQEGRHAAVYFQVLVSGNPNDAAMTAVRKAGLEVIKASDSKPLSPGTRRTIIIVLLLALILGYFLTLVAGPRDKPAS